MEGGLENCGRLQGRNSSRGLKIKLIYSKQSPRVRESEASQLQRNERPVSGMEKVRGRMTHGRRKITHNLKDLSLCPKGNGIPLKSVRREMIGSQVLQWEGERLSQNPIER